MKRLKDEKRRQRSQGSMQRNLVIVRRTHRTRISESWQHGIMEVVIYLKKLVQDAIKL